MAVGSSTSSPAVSSPPPQEPLPAEDPAGSGSLGGAAGDPILIASLGFAPNVFNPVSPVGVSESSGGSQSATEVAPSEPSGTTEALPELHEADESCRTLLSLCWR